MARSKGKGASKDRRSEERKAIETLRRHQRRLLDHSGVTSVGIGFRWKNGEVTDEICIQCTVENKVAPEALAARGIPPLPESVEASDGSRISVDVVERNYRPSYEVREESSERESIDYHDARRSFQDPLVPGISISHIAGSAGTLGAIVFDSETGEPLVLSNWHVLDSGATSPGNPVVQPGPYDDPDTACNECGYLLRSHLGLAGDCAVSRIELRDWERNVLELNRVPRRMAEVQLGDAVVKSGRTTGVTYGIVSRVGVVAKIDYGGGTGVREVGGFEIRPNPAKPALSGEISMSGDSGSLWMVDVPDDHEDADVSVGLHFAGETDPDPQAEHALACRITTVAKKLRISLEPSPEHATDEARLWREVFDRLDRLEETVSAAPTASTGTCCNRTSTSAVGDAAAVPEAGVPVHGNWCGPGHGGGRPVDALDEACMRHDKCYDRKGYFDCDCDRALVNEVDRLIVSGRLSGRTLAKAMLIRAWFSRSPCVRHVRIGGRTIPIPGRNTLVPCASSVARSVNTVGRRVLRRVGL